MEYTETGYLRVYHYGIIMSRGGIRMRLKELRKKRNITQFKLAMDLNMSQNTISRYETGAREPSISELIKIADYFEVSLDYLLEREKSTDDSQ